MPNATRDRIVDSARQLFWEQGYAATSLAQISEASGANTGSIYYFFKTKEAILEAVLDHYDEQLFVWLVDPVFERTDDPLERIFGVIGTYRAVLIETDFSLGGPVGGLAVELGGEHVEARRKLERIFQALSDVLEGCAKEISGAVPDDAPAASELASLAMTVIEGGIVQARAMRSIEPFDRSVACLRDYLGRLLDDERVGATTR